MQQHDGLCNPDQAIGYHFKCLLKRHFKHLDVLLLLIEPTGTGHVVSSVLDRPTRTARVLGVHTATLDERVRVLTRRDKVGRTGVLLNEELAEGETFESRLRYIADRNSVVRRQLKMRGADL